MIETESIKMPGYEHAIRNINAKGYRMSKIGSFETFVSVNSKSINLGTYLTEEEAKEAVLNHRINRFCSSCASMNLNPCDGIEWKNNYIVFPNGEVLNLHGKKMIGMVDRCGYREVIINGKNERVHRIIATIFVPNPNNYDTVNHKDGNKLNNKVENLEWCTRSQNVLHAYRMRLERRITGEKHHSHKLTNEDVRYIKSHYKYRDRVYGAAALGRKYNIHYSTILSVVRGETWREVV